MLRRLLLEHLARELGLADAVVGVLGEGDDALDAHRRQRRRPSTTRRSVLYGEVLKTSG